MNNKWKKLSLKHQRVPRGCFFVTFWSHLGLKKVSVGPSVGYWAPPGSIWHRFGANFGSNFQLFRSVSMIMRHPRVATARQFGIPKKQRMSRLICLCSLLNLLLILKTKRGKQPKALFVKCLQGNSAYLKD